MLGYIKFAYKLLAQKDLNNSLSKLYPKLREKRKNIFYNYDSIC